MSSQKWKLLGGCPALRTKWSPSHSLWDPCPPQSHAAFLHHLEAAVIWLWSWHHLACASPTTKALWSVLRDHTSAPSVLSSSRILVPVCAGKLIPGPQHIPNRRTRGFHITYVWLPVHSQPPLDHLGFLLKLELCKRLLCYGLGKWWQQQASKHTWNSSPLFQICPTCIWLNFDMRPTVTRDHLPIQLMWLLHFASLFQQESFLTKRWKFLTMRKFRCLTIAQNTMYRDLAHICVQAWDTHLRQNICFCCWLFLLFSISVFRYWL